MIAGTELSHNPIFSQMSPEEQDRFARKAADVRHGSIKRVASGVGEGSMSIAFIHEYLALAP